MPYLPWASLLPARTGGKPATVASVVRKLRRSVRYASMRTSSEPHYTRPVSRAATRASVLREAQGRIPELEEILRADSDPFLHLGLGGHDVEAIVPDPGDDLLRHLGGRVAAGEPVGEA